MQKMALIFLFFLSFFPLYSDRQTMPVSYQGRIRPAEGYARLWLKDFYGKEEIEKGDLDSFSASSSSALTFLWKLQIKGHKPFENSPLFLISEQNLKNLIGLNPAQKRLKNFFQILFGGFFS